jgi:hypothetical protein
MQWIDLLMRLHYFVQGKSCKRSSMIRPDRSISYPFHGATLLQHKISTWLFQLPSLSCLRKRLESDVSDQNNSHDPQQWIESQAYVPLHAIQYISRAWSIGPFLQFIKLLCVALNTIPPTPPQSARVIPSWLMCRRALIDLICRVQSFFIYPCIDLLIEFPAAPHYDSVHAMHDTTLLCFRRQGHGCYDGFFYPEHPWPCGPSSSSEMYIYIYIN